MLFFFFATPALLTRRAGVGVIFMKRGTTCTEGDLGCMGGERVALKGTNRAVF